MNKEGEKTRAEGTVDTEWLSVSYNVCERYYYYAFGVSPKCQLAAENASSSPIGLLVKPPNRQGHTPANASTD